MKRCLLAPSGILSCHMCARKHALNKPFQTNFLWIVFENKTNKQDLCSSAQNVFLSHTLQNAGRTCHVRNTLVHRIKMYPFCLYPITIKYILLT